MACIPESLSSLRASPAKDVIPSVGGVVPRSGSLNGVLCDRCARMLRSRTGQFPLRCGLERPPTAPECKLNNGGSVGVSPFRYGFEAEAGEGTALAVTEEVGDDAGGPHPAPHELGKGKRANWVERLLELRRQWKDRRQEEPADHNEGETGHCDAVYDAGGDKGEGMEEFDREAFSALLAGVPRAELKLFSQLAFLCVAAYVIPDLKVELRNYYGLHWVTSSLEKKSPAVKAEIETDSTAGAASTTQQPTTAAPSWPTGEPGQKRSIRAAAAYGIAASAASYVHSRTKETLPAVGGRDVDLCRPLDDGAVRRPAVAGDVISGRERAQESEVAAHVATSTMTAVIAAGEKARLDAARDLRSLQSSPCEWFVCDDPGTRTRCFVIQGSDSLASWQANLFFEPTEFEGTDTLVHRGIYEAAKGIYEQFMPEILSHLSRHGERAKLRFTGHSLGGSLSLLVHLMLLVRGVVRTSALLPVVTFGSPFVFCGGGRVLERLGLDESQVRCVMMHRDIVPRAFSCSYPDRIAQVLRRLNRAFRSHPCLNKDKLLYSPLGKLYILQPDEKTSPPHPLLPPGCAMYALGGGGEASMAKVASAVRAFLNSPHPLETLSHPAAYGSEGTILRDHDSCNYLKAVNEVLRRHTRGVKALYGRPIPNLMCSMYLH